MRRRIAVFTEGQTEQVLVRHIVLRVVDNSKLGFLCLRISGKQHERVPYSYGDENSETYIVMLNVGNDESVITAVQDRKQGLTKKGFQIIALRDIYSEEYLRQAGRCMKQSVVEKMIRSKEEQFDKSTYGSQASLHFAVMEVEAWYLGMYELLEKIHSTLTADFVESKTGLKLADLDPQSKFVHPSSVLDSLLRLVGDKYKKNRKDAERFASLVTVEYLQTATGKGRCSHLKQFLATLLNAVGRDDIAHAFE